MKKLSKAQLTERDEIVSQMNEAKDSVTTAVDDYNDALSPAREAVSTAVAEFNSAVEKANSFLGELASDAQNYFDERSEKWQEGDAGDQYNSWKEQFEDEVEEATFDEPAELDLPEGIDEALDRLESLVETPGEM